MTTPARLAGHLIVGLLLPLLGCTCTPRPPRGQAPETMSAPVTDPSFPDPALPGLGEGDPALMAELAGALEARGDDYVPRTHHLEADGRPTYTNRLILENSPYLLQHAHNPVNWYAWGDEAFERARAQHRPVLVSIGYSTCHWCHVMERESFEDEEIAAFLNEHFVCIKVDREERPDVDEVYMTAVQLMSGHGGWPLNVFLTPDRQPFFGGTYFPPRDGARGSRHGFLTILQALDREYREKPESIVQAAADLSEAIRKSSTGAEAGEVPDARSLKQGAESLLSRFDPEWGGFGKAPKFPTPTNLAFLLRWARRQQDDQARAAVITTLDRMVAGGVHDHVGGGFHRYSTDREWLVPHFEKMLYDNAQLASVLVEAWQATGEVRHADAARETLDYLMREMSAPGGGFHSATDADSPVPGSDHAEEGWFFTWTPEELAELLDGEQLAAVTAYYGVTRAGNFEARNILHVRRGAAEVAVELSITEEALQTRLASARAVLYEARSRRPPPLRDDKVLASWNGLTIGAFARAGFALDEPRYVARARAAADFVLEHMRDEQGRLLRSHHEGRAAHGGVLDDHAFLIAGLLDLFEACGEPRYLDAALELQAQLDERFWDEAHGGYFMTPSDGEALLVRSKPDYDGAEPSGNAVAALNLLRLHELTEDDAHLERARRLFAGLSATLRKAPVAATTLASALDFLLDRPKQIFVIVTDDAEASAALVDVVRASYLPNRSLAVVHESKVEAMQAHLPGLEGKRAMGGQPTGFVCEQRACKLPAREASVLREQLAEVTPYPAPVGAP